MKAKTIMNTLGITMAVGSAAMLFGSAAVQPSFRKKAMKTVNSALKRAGNLMDDVQDLLK